MYKKTSFLVYDHLGNVMVNLTRLISFYKLLTSKNKVRFWASPVVQERFVDGRYNMRAKQTNTVAQRSEVYLQLPWVSVQKHDITRIILIRLSLV